MQVENVLLLEVCVCISFYFLQDVMCCCVEYCQQSNAYIPVSTWGAVNVCLIAVVYNEYIELVSEASLQICAV